VLSRRIAGSPNEVLAGLRKVLKSNPPDTYTLAIWKRDGTGGHAITPYAVDNKGGGKVDVLIYDNNWPGQTRAVSFDTKADTWTYDAATDPSQQDEITFSPPPPRTRSIWCAPWRRQATRSPRFRSPTPRSPPSGSPTPPRQP
jgi:hypothetical protein